MRTDSRCRGTALSRGSSPDENVPKNAITKPQGPLKLEHTHYAQGDRTACEPGPTPASSLHLFPCAIAGSAGGLHIRLWGEKTQGSYGLVQVLCAMSIRAAAALARCRGDCSSTTNAILQLSWVHVVFTSKARFP